MACSRGGRNPDQDQSLGKATWKSAGLLAATDPPRRRPDLGNTRGAPPRGGQGPARDEVRCAQVNSWLSVAAEAEPGHAGDDALFTGRSDKPPRREPRRGEAADAAACAFPSS